MATGWRHQLATLSADEEGRKEKTKPTLRIRGVARAYLVRQDHCLISPLSWLADAVDARVTVEPGPDTSRSK